MVMFSCELGKEDTIFNWENDRTSAIKKAKKIPDNVQLFNRIQITHSSSPTGYLAWTPTYSLEKIGSLGLMDHCK